MTQKLLVEGNDDRIVINEIIKKHNINKTFEIIDKGGYPPLRDSISSELKAETAAIGIVVDADSEISGRWQSLQTVLTKQGYHIPKKPVTTGTIINLDGYPKIGLWLMPNNIENGMLEDFVRHLIPEDDELMPFVDETIELLESRGIQKYKAVHKSKAKVHTWLAWQKEPGTPLGSAIIKTYLNTNQELCNQFIDWINELFNSEN